MTFLLEYVDRRVTTISPDNRARMAHIFSRDNVEKVQECFPETIHDSFLFFFPADLRLLPTPTTGLLRPSNY